jgi:hypothetical protein
MLLIQKKRHGTSEQQYLIRDLSWKIAIFKYMTIDAGSQEV